ncbi:unnamed protein product [Paramecium sonneborni]|uniref:Uncharacterized protein n=1 Tax=Paramecium sonneborni TaxID=65129 RepID=A0A8S1RLX5_9CILI|nr:unnamed protein product [Paramecium sonneborni]
MKVDLRNQSFEKIRIKNTSLVGGTFVKCNLNESEFNNVDISGVNLNGALLFNCRWKNIKIEELNKLEGHSYGVYSVCFSPDGTTILASGNYDNHIYLWDVKIGQQKASLNGHSEWVSSVCFSSEGSTIASGSGDDSICLWDVKTRQLKAKLDGHSDIVRSVCFSPDGFTLASSSCEKTIRLWDFKTGQQKAKLNGSTECPFQVFQSIVFQDCLIYQILQLLICLSNSTYVKTKQIIIPNTILLYYLFKTSILKYNLLIRCYNNQCSQHQFSFRRDVLIRSNNLILFVNYLI